MRRGVACVVLGLGLGLAACGGRPKPVHAPEAPWHPATAMLTVYAAPDGSLTKAQLLAGLHRDYDKADINHDGCLDENEVRAVNEARWKEDGSTASPLIDFRHTGCVDFDEFAAAPLSLFDLIDRDGTGKLTAQQLRPWAKPKPSDAKPAPAGNTTNAQPPASP